MTAPAPAPGDATRDPLRDRVVAAVGDRYDVGAELGRGAAGVVYRATEVRLQRPVALKVLPPELAYRAGVRERFLREAQTAAGLAHPNVVPVYAAGDDGGVAWLAMALVDGETLGARLARAPRVPPADAARLLAEVADALDYAHRRGVVHRDVKPDNVLLDREGGRAVVTDFGIARAAEEDARLTATGATLGTPAYMSPEQALDYAHRRGVVHRDVKPDNVLLDRESGRAVVTDFGIARAAEEDARLTATGATLGTPAYMSPEQALGEARVDGRSDQYALGVVGYQLLTGVLPFQASSATGMLMKHVGEAPRPVRERAPEVPPALAAAVERALAKKPEDRWPDAGAFRDALRRAAGDAARAGDAAAGQGAVAARPRPGVRDHLNAPPAPPAPNGRPPAESPYAPYGDVPLAPPGLPRPLPQPMPGQSRREWQQAQREWREHLREERREQRERAREWGEYAREQMRDQRDAYRDAAAAGAAGLPVPVPPYGVAGPNGLPNALPNGLPGAFPQLPLEYRADAFRRKAVGAFVLLAFLTLINAMHFFIPPWVVFPAWGVLGDLRRRHRLLREAGVGFWDVALNGREALGRADASPDGLARLERRVRRLRRRRPARLAFGLMAAAFLTAAAATGEGGLLVPFFVFLVLTVVTLLRTARDTAALRRAGVSVSAALSDDWRAAVAAADPRPRPLVLAEEARRLAGDAVLAGPYGPAVREALDDREAVRGIVAGLSEADRALVPVRDVNPTLDGLVARVAELAQRLDAIDRDAAPDALAQVDARLAAARTGAPSAERERTVALLERQRASLAELAGRRDELLARLESARAALRNLRLDFLKLREGGVGALGGVGSATQEARALSREIGYALEAAGEVRGGR